jgi:hypothetical protein
VLGYVHNSVCNTQLLWHCTLLTILFYFILFAYSDIFRPRVSMMASIQCHRHSIGHCVPTTIVAMLRCWYRHMAAIVGRCNRELRTTWAPWPASGTFFQPQSSILSTMPWPLHYHPPPSARCSAPRLLNAGCSTSRVVLLSGVQSCLLLQRGH